MRTEWLGVLLLASGCGHSAWDRARDDNTVEAYREFIFENPDDPHVPEAREKEADTAYLRLGERPSKRALRDYLNRYSGSARALEVQAQIEKIQLEEAIVLSDLAAIKHLVKTNKDAALQARAESALEYLEGRIAAFARLDGSHFEKYLRDHDGDEFSEHARLGLEWVRRARGKRQSVIPMETGGSIDDELLRSVRKTFQLGGVRTKVVRDLRSALRDGEIGYLLAQFESGEEIELFGRLGKMSTFVPVRSGVVLQVVLREDGKTEALWSAGAAADDGFDGEDFPVMPWNTYRSVIAMTNQADVIAELERLAQFVVATTPESLHLYDVTVPDVFRIAYSLGQPQREGIRTHLETSGRMIATWGDSLALLRVESTSKVAVNEAASLEIVGGVRAGVFVGERFYFVSSRGLFAHEIGWERPKRLSKTVFQHITRCGGSLLAMDESRFATLDLDANGGIAATHWSRPPAGFLEGRSIRSSWTDGVTAVLVNSAGSTAVITPKGETLLDRRIVGTVRDVDADRTHLVTAGIRGVTLLSRRQDQVTAVASVPLTGCTDVVLKYPFAYASCGQILVTIQLAALERP